MPSPKVASARTIANRAAKIVYNKAAVDALQMGLADGLIQLGNEILADASRGPGGSGVGSLRDPAKAAERGVPMMLDTGLVSVWALGKLVSGSTDVAAAKNKPKGAKTPKDQAVMFVGFSSPLSHFAELGTIKEPARPFLLPAFGRHVQDADKWVLPAIRKRVNAVPE